MKNILSGEAKKAFRILRRNYGAPGNDGISIRDIKEKYHFFENIVLEQFRNGIFLFEDNPKKVTVNKLGKKRVFFVYNLLERWTQQILKNYTEPLIEINLTEYTYAYRRKKSDIDSYQYILKNNPNYILYIDIKDFFYSIDKIIVFRQLTELGMKDSMLSTIKGSFQHCEKGIPSGHVMSCLLANLYLNDFDHIFQKDYVRYSDDMMFATDTREQAIQTLFIVRKMLIKKGLYLNDNKTKIIIKPTMNTFI